MTVSAFIRSYLGDINWLYYCLRSLLKRGSQFHQIVLCVPDSERFTFLELITKWEVKGIVELHTWMPVVENGYIDQQITKCHAERFCTGDFIMHFDSDCIALREIELGEFFVAGRPKLLFRRWEQAGTGITWQAVTAGILKRAPAFETMASHPFLYHRSTHQLFRECMERQHKMSFNHIFRNREEFSEFNAIGNFCHQSTPDAYHFVRAGSPEDDFPRPFKQFWSRGGIPHEEIEKLL